MFNRSAVCAIVAEAASANVQYEIAADEALSSFCGDTLPRTFLLRIFCTYETQVTITAYRLLADQLQTMDSGCLALRAVRQNTA